MDGSLRGFVALFLTVGYRFLRQRGFPGSQPGDFPRGLGGVAGVPIAAKTPPIA